MKIDINNDLYPVSLKKIKNPPSTLYVQGNTNLLNSKSIAIVGSRSASNNGMIIAKQFAEQLSKSGITIVSGLAIGIDTIAHTYSYQNKGKTIAVLGCGFNNLFPQENLELYNNILANNGLIVSEYPPDEVATSNHFRDRNRIISGLSSGVLIIEASCKSGTGITASRAKEQGKKIFAIPHEIWDIHGKGTNRLIKNGAMLVTCTNDILKELDFKNIELKYPVFKLAQTKKSSIRPKRIVSFSDEKQAKIYSLLSNLPTSINELVLKSGYSITEISSSLFLLELNDYIKKVEGGYICI